MQEEQRGVLQEIKAIQEQEHALQKESLNVRLQVEQIDTNITECQNKIKHWEKEVFSGFYIILSVLSSWCFVNIALCVSILVHKTRSALYR